MRKSVVWTLKGMLVLSVFIVSLCFPALASADSCTTEEINQLLNEYGDAWKIKDEVAMANLVSSDYVWARTKDFGDKFVSWDKTELLDWLVASKVNNNIYDEHDYHNRTIRTEHNEYVPTSSLNFVSADLYASWSHLGASPETIVDAYILLTIRKEADGVCRVVFEHRNIFYNSYIY